MPAQTIQELEAQFDEAIAKLPGLVLKVTEQSALGALALVDRRITEKGQAANGAPFEDYTPSYKKRKQKAGRYTGKVNFSLTGQMLASTTTGFENIGPTERSVSEGRAKVVFDGRDVTTKKKLEGNNKTRPGFLNPSAEEVKMVNKSANETMGRELAAIFQ